MLRLKPQNWAAVVAEFIGTGVLAMVFLIMANYAAFPFYIGVSAAIALSSVYFMFGAVSGAHVNPALTFGMWTARKIGTLKAVSYITAQMLGGLGAWQLYSYITGRAVAASSATFTWPIFVAEAVGAGILAMGLAAAVSRAYDAFQTAAAYGAAFFVGILITALTLTSSQGYVGYINPALALGLRHFGLAYVLGPLAGAVVGVNLYMWLFNPAASKSKNWLARWFSR